VKDSGWSYLFRRMHNINRIWYKLWVKK
jgi:hypothetical protein